MKIEINEFIDTIKLELENYEDLTPSQINDWETTFRQLLVEKKLSKKNFPDDKHYVLPDESEIFAIADDYCNALEFNDLKTYWNSFK